MQSVDPKVALGLAKRSVHADIRSDICMGTLRFALPNRVKSSIKEGEHDE